LKRFSDLLPRYFQIDYSEYMYKIEGGNTWKQAAALVTPPGYGNKGQQLFNAAIGL